MIEDYSNQFEVCMVPLFTQISDRPLRKSVMSAEYWIKA